MADIFVSYTSADRPRAETLKRWFEDIGWSVWIDRDVDLGEMWAERVQRELADARVIVVLWGADARRSEWVQKEAATALQSGRLLQIHGTGLPLLPPFDAVQAVRMQSWSGESGHSERVKLLRAVADRLGTTLPPPVETVTADEQLTAYHVDVAEVLELAFHYCARQVESARRRKERGYADPSDFDAIGPCFAAMLAVLRTDAGTADDREGILHRLMDDFLHQLNLLEPVPGALT